MPDCLSPDGWSSVVLWHLMSGDRCVFEHISSPVRRPWSPVAKRLAAVSSLRIGAAFDRSSPLWKHLFRELRPDKTRCSYCRAGREREEKHKHVRGMSTQIVFAFHLVGFLSIQLFMCISVGVCANSWHVYVFVCKKCQTTETKTAWCVKSCRRNAQNPIRGGLCRLTQTEMNAGNGSTVQRLSAHWVCNSLSFGFERKKQGDKLSW